MRVGPSTTTVLEEARRCRQRYRRNGFVLGPLILTPKEIRRGVAAIDAVMAGKYETGIAPLDAWWSKDDDPRVTLRKIEQPHVANRTILALVTNRKLAQWLAGIVGAKRLQIWATQILYKPGSGTDAERFGWHQDAHYWKSWWTPESNVFTCWLALTNVRNLSGPVTYVRGSHRGGLLDPRVVQRGAPSAERAPGGLALGVRRSALRWKEVPALMSAGAFSLHHRLTVHASPPNYSGRPRYSLAIHLCTEKATPTPGHGNPWMTQPGYDYVSYLDDPAVCPVVYERSDDSTRVTRATRV